LRLASVTAALLAAAGMSAPVARGSLSGIFPTLGPGQAEVLVTSTSDATYWLPVSGQPRGLEVFAQLRSPRDFGRVRIFIRHQRAKMPCGASAAADQGTEVPTLIPNPVRGHADRVDEEILNVTLDERHAVRFCMWIAGSARDRVAPSDQVVPILGSLSGAAAVGFGSLRPAQDGAIWLVDAASTGPFGVAQTDVACGSSTQVPTGAGLSHDLWRFSEGASGSADCNGSQQFMFSGSLVGPMVFPYAYGLDATHVVHIGACEFGAMGYDSVADAAAYVRAVGCQVGRVYEGPRLEDTPDGDVVGVYMDAGQVVLAPAGTVVDLLTSGPPGNTVSTSQPEPGEPQPPEGGECKDVVSFSPRFASEEHTSIGLGLITSDSLPVAMSGSISLGAVGICERAIHALDPFVTASPPGLGLDATYEVARREVHPHFDYSFAPLGWHLPGGTGGHEPSAPVIDWPHAEVLAGGEGGLSLNFAFGLGEPLEPEVQLVKVPVLKATASLVASDNAVLDATVGPELELTMKIDKEKLEELENEDVAQGEDAQTAADQIAEQANTQIREEIGAENDLVSPRGAPSAALSNDAIDISGNVAQDVANTLPADAGAGPAASTVGSSVVEILGVVEVPAVEVEAAQEVGDVLIDVAAFEVLDARADRHPLLPGLHRARGGIERVGLLRARPIRRLGRRALHRGPFPARQIPDLVRSRLMLPITARVGPLATTARRLRPGASVTVIAPVLAGSRPHDALLMLAGPGYRASRLLRVANATAGATIRLPRHLKHGTWTITIEDLSEVIGLPDHTLLGSALVRIAVFAV
jgi:hypothetical protein